MAEAEQPRKAKRTPAAAAAEHAPWKPTAWEHADALSLKRLALGQASSVEQQRAYRWILLCTGLNDEPYRPGSEDGRRETDYALGKAHVGRQIVKLVNVDLARLRGGEEHERT